MEAEGRIYFGKKGDAQPGVIRYLSEVAGVVPWTWWPHDETGQTDEARKEIREYLGNTNIFDTPKPIRLIVRMLEIATSEDDIVLDFFAGSCTTAHAVFVRNQSDDGRRRFILVQLPEPCPEGSEARANGFKTVAAIGRQRIRSAAQKIADVTTSELKLKEVAPHDLGFRAFNLDRSNFLEWDGEAALDKELAQQIEMYVDHLSESSSDEDVLYELLLKAGFSLTTRVAGTMIAGKHVFSIEDGALMICLEKEITPELIDALAEANPLQVICLDEAFKGNDQLKANAVQTFQGSRGSRKVGNRVSGQSERRRMKLKFDPSLQYQKDAINAVVDVFDWPAVRTRRERWRSSRFKSAGCSRPSWAWAIGLRCRTMKFFKNVHAVQEANDIEKVACPSRSRILRRDGDRHRQDLRLSSHDLRAE